MPIRQAPAFLQELHRTLMDAALAKNGFQNDRARIVVDSGSQPVHIVLLYEAHFFQERFESFAMLVLPSER